MEISYVSIARKHWVKPGLPVKTINLKAHSSTKFEIKKQAWIIHFKGYVPDEEMGEFTLRWL